MSARLTYGTIVADDFLGLCEFYRRTLDLAEVPEYRNDAFVALDAGGVLLTFTPLKTYTTLGIEAWAAPTGTSQYLTFDVDSDDEVEVRSARAVRLGGRLVREPYETRYQSWQTVLADPAGNLFRIHHVR